MKQRAKSLITALLVFCSLCLFTACSDGGQPEVQQQDTGAADAAQQPAPETVDTIQPNLTPDHTFSLTLLKGPTGMGAAPLLGQSSRGMTENGYDVTIAATPDQAASSLVKGETDLAALPINLAANLYQKLDGDLQILAVNTLGVLYVLENGDSVQTVQDLDGKTLYATGQGSTPEYILNAILAGNGLQNVTVEYLSEHSELAAWLVEGKADLGMLPEPNVSVALQKSQQLRRALDLTAAWEALYPDAPLVQGCIVAKKSLIETAPEAIDAFLAEYRQSVDYAIDEPQNAGWYMAEFGILDNADIAEQAIPNCNLCCITGTEMQQAADHMFQILYEADPAAIGGELPAADIYYGVQ